MKDEDIIKDDEIQYITEYSQYKYYYYKIFVFKG